MRKNNRNYNFFKRAKNKYENSSLLNNISDEILTKLNSKKDKANTNYKISSKESLNAHIRVKMHTISLLTMQ